MMLNLFLTLLFVFSCCASGNTAATELFDSFNSRFGDLFVSASESLAQFETSIGQDITAVIRRFLYPIPISDGVVPIAGSPFGRASEGRRLNLLNLLINFLKKLFFGKSEEPTEVPTQEPTEVPTQEPTEDPVTPAATEESILEEASDAFEMLFARTAEGVEETIEFWQVERERILVELRENVVQDGVINNALLDAGSDQALEDVSRVVQTARAAITVLSNEAESGVEMLQEETLQRIADL